jgi:hypothetical protein
MSVLRTMEVAKTATVASGLHPSALRGKRPLSGTPAEALAQSIRQLERRIAGLEGDIKSSRKALLLLARERKNMNSRLLDLQKNAGRARSDVSFIELKLTDTTGRLEATKGKIVKLDSEISEGIYGLLDENILSGKERRMSNFVFKAALLIGEVKRLFMQHGAAKEKAEALAAELEREAERVPSLLQALNETERGQQAKLEKQLFMLELLQLELSEKNDLLRPPEAPKERAVEYATA